MSPYFHFHLVHLNQSSQFKQEQPWHFYYQRRGTFFENFFCMRFLGLNGMQVNVKFRKLFTIVGYIMVFGSELLGGFLFQFFVKDTSFPSIQSQDDELG
ncbi:unnamed protein product [Camellia sinensis]